MRDKKAWLLSPGTMDISSEHLSFVHAWLTPLRFLLLDGCVARERAKASVCAEERAAWDELTLGGNTTFKKFADILFRPVNDDDVEIWDKDM